MVSAISIAIAVAFLISLFALIIAVKSRNNAVPADDGGFYENASAHKYSACGIIKIINKLSVTRNFLRNQKQISTTLFRLHAANMRVTVQSFQ